MSTTKAKSRAQKSKTHQFSWGENVALLLVQYALDCGNFVAPLTSKLKKGVVVLRVEESLRPLGGKGILKAEDAETGGARRPRFSGRRIDLRSWQGARSVRDTGGRYICLTFSPLCFSQLNKQVHMSTIRFESCLTR